MDTTQIPAEHLFTMELDWIGEGTFEFDGPFGQRSFRRAGQGRVTGKRISGRIGNEIATDCGRLSPDGSTRHVDAHVVIDTDDGEAILLQVRGRQSPRYGKGNSRLQILITAPAGRHEWLGNRQAIGIGRTENGVEIIDVYGLLVPDEPGCEAADHHFTGSLILERQSRHNPDAPHRVIRSPFGTRYISVAESGGVFTGPATGGTYPHGYAWSPHRLGPGEGIGYMHHDVNSVIQADDGTPILMAYTGLNSPDLPAGNWCCAVLFETPVGGPCAWFNEILAIGIGKATGGGARYRVYDFE